MQFQLSLDITPLSKPLTYTNSILLIGSCFTEHISAQLVAHKFKVLSNPNGILFNPLSVAHSLDDYINVVSHTQESLFYYNELWNSWRHHTRFSDIEKETALQNINHSQQQASAFIKTAGCVIITLGSAFQYYLKENGTPVANNHRAPAQWFDKKLLATNEIVNALDHTLKQLFALSPHVQVIFTISPVRHIRDGVVDNNRSKARLIDAVHEVCAQHESAYYFPAYELVIDILRDYRYYDIDFVHPNYLATNYVWEQFTKACIAPAAQAVMVQVNELVTASRHKPRFPQTLAHQKFKEAHAVKAEELMRAYPFLDLSEELAYFKQ